jgi:hypothetical protein
MLWTCAEPRCGTQYAAGLPRCPQCGLVEIAETNVIGRESLAGLKVKGLAGARPQVHGSLILEGVGDGADLGRLAANQHDTPTD